MHNNIMAAGSRDRPLMLVPGRYPQWRSRFLRYVDTRPNGEALRKYILSGPYKPTTILVQAVEATDDSPAVPEHTTVETQTNMSPENKAHFQVEKEAIHLILSGIRDEIYSTVDACQRHRKNNIISELPSCVGITPNEPVDSLSMGDENLDTVPVMESNEFIKSCVENLVPNPSESEGDNECDVPAGFITFSNVLFNADYDFDSGDDQSFSDEDLLKKIYSNPLFDEEIIPMKIEPHSLNVESDLIESMPNHDSSITISSKIYSLFDEFVGELTLLKSIPPGINETDCHPEKETRFAKRLLYDNSFPRPPEEIVSNNSNPDIESFSPSPITIKDSDSFMEEIDLSFNPDDPMLPSIKDDSERDILILEELPSNYSLSLPIIESFYFNIPLPYRPPAKPPDGNTGTLNIKMMGDVSDQKLELSRFVTIIKQQHKLDEVSYHKLFDILKQYQNEVNELRAEKLARNANPLALFGTQRTVNVVAASENVRSKVVQQSGIQCFNCREYGHFAKECRKPKRVKDFAYHKEKMLLCKQAEQGVPLQAEQYDWLADTNEEVDEQELEAHYSYMAKIKEDEQNDVDSDDERVALANLIANLKLDVDENKKIQKQLKKANTTLAQELKDCKAILAETMVKEKHDELMKHSLLTKSHYEGLVKQKTKVITDLKHRKEHDIEKMLSMEKQLNFLNEVVYKRSQSIQTIHMMARKKEMHADLKYVESLEKEIDELESEKAEFSDMYDVILQECVKERDCLAQKLSKQTESVSKKVKNDTVCNEKASNVFRKEREQYFEIQDLKAKLQDKNISISELKKLIEKGKGKYVDTKFDRPSIVRKPNAQWIPKPLVLGKPTPFSDSLKRKYFPKTKSLSKANVSEGLSKPVTAQTLPQTAKKAMSLKRFFTIGIKSQELVMSRITRLFLCRFYKDNDDGGAIRVFMQQQQ
nr:hypothetical protein [Tanacetum cinerariifolium]